MSWEDVEKILLANGFVLMRQKGSHMSYRIPGDDATASATVPRKRMIPVGTLQSIIRQSKLDRALFCVTDS
jgi:predicted RNA binding protein YcfA (HicA-like mRNA interferase family)